MRLLLSGFIIDLVSWFFSTYPKFTWLYYYRPTGANTAVTYKLIAKEIVSANVIKFYLTSPCTSIIDVSSSTNIYFNPNTECSTSVSGEIATNVPPYVQYAAAQANQTTLVVQIKAPPDIT
jgi:hypothetical protein